MPRTSKKPVELAFDDSDQILDPQTCLLDQQNEYYELFELLSTRFDVLKERVTQTHGDTVRYDGARVIDHVNAVVMAADRLATDYWQDRYEYERQYNRKVCQTVGLMHEYLLIHPLTYEDLLQLTDYATTNALMAVIPDFRKPFSDRLLHWNNAIGHAQEHAKLVRIADLLYDGMRINKLLKGRENNIELPLGFQGHVRTWLEEVKTVSLTLVDFLKDCSLRVWRDKLKDLTVLPSEYAKVK